MVDSSCNKCIDEITNSLHKIKNPVHLSNVHDWVIKLTTGEPNNWKTDYLRLLEYTLKSDDGVQEPFKSAPPENLFSDCNGLVKSSRWLGTKAAEAAVAISDYHERISSLAAGGGYTSDSNSFTGASADSVNACMARIQQPNRPEMTTKQEMVTTTVSDTWSEIEPQPELVDLLKRMNYETMSLQQFMGDVKRYTCDSGRLMGNVADELLADFQKAAEVAYDDRTQKLGDALAKEQVTLLLRYRKNEHRMISRAQILQDHLRELMPTFQYEKYIVDPDRYIKNNILEKKIAAKKMENDGLDIVKTDDDGDRMNESMMHQKKMMCALNWLRSEVERADCENVMLRKRYDVVVAEIAKTSKRKITIECLAKTQRLEARAQLDELRYESARQVELIDSYVERISMERASHKNNTVCN